MAKKKAARQKKATAKKTPRKKAGPKKRAAAKVGGRKKAPAKKAVAKASASGAEPGRARRPKGQAPSPTSPKSSSVLVQAAGKPGAAEGRQRCGVDGASLHHFGRSGQQRLSQYESGRRQAGSLGRSRYPRCSARLWLNKRSNTAEPRATPLTRAARRETICKCSCSSPRRATPTLRRSTKAVVCRDGVKIDGAGLTADPRVIENAKCSD